MLDKLFTSKNRIKILKHLIFDSNQSYIREISKKLEISPSAVKKEIDNFKEIGLVDIDKGIVKINKNCLFFNEIKSLFVKTDYVYYPIKDSLSGNKEIKNAFIFGSFANKKDNLSSDIDLMVVGEVKQGEVFKMIKTAEKVSGREINPVVWTEQSLKKNKESALFKDIMKKNKIFIIGDENGLKKIAG